MSADERLDSILDAWQEAFEHGTDLTPADLCRGAPELQPEVERRIAQLRRLAGLRPRGDGDPTISGAVAPSNDTATHSDGPGPAAPRVMPSAAPPGYEILEEIGRGGMGVVYKARQLSLNRIVALKMVLGGARAKPTDLLRFRTEGEAVARLSHANVVQVHEVGAHDGSPYLNLEYCAGGSLDTQLANAPLAPRKAAQLVLSLAHAVHVAHQAGIVHRDLKPANILLAADGTPKVADFGLAKWADGGDGVTVTGSVVGTPSFMAPEQASGNLKALDRRADVYALGAILYTCLTGRPPFKGSTPLDTLDQVRTVEPVRVRDLQPRVPRDLETICLKCLQKGADRRYISAAALADDLQRFLDRRSIQARPVGGFERSWRWCRRNPAVAALVAGVLVSSLTGTGVAAWFAETASARRVEAELARLTAQREKEEADLARDQAQRDKVLADAAQAAAVREQLAADEARKAAVKEKADADLARAEAVREQRRAEWAAYVSQVSLSQREWEVGNAPAALGILAGTNPALRGWEYAYLSHSFERDQKWTARHPGSVTDLAVSPDGTRIVTASSSALVVWAADTGRALLRVPIQCPGLKCVAFSPDGACVLTGDGDVARDGVIYSGPGRITVWDASTGKVRNTFPPLRGSVGAIAFTPDGARIVAGSGDGRINWINYPSGEVVRFAATNHGVSLRVALSPDGKVLAAVGNRGGVEFRDGTTGEVLRTGAAAPAVEGQAAAGFADLVFSPDGGLVAGVRNGLFVWEVATGRLVCSSTEPGSVPRARWTPNGAALVTSSEDRTVSVWDARSGRRLQRFQGHLAALRGLGVAAEAIFSADYTGAVIAWDRHLPSDPLELRSPGQSWFSGLGCSPDGRTLVSSEGGSVNGVRVWDLRSGRAARPLTGHTAFITDLALSRDATVAFTSSQDGTARAWDLTAGIEKAVFRGHTGTITAIACAPGAEWLATGGADGKVLVRNLVDGTILRSPVARTVPVSRIATDPEGRRLAASFDDGLIIIWETGAWKEVARLDHGRVSPTGDGHPILALAFGPGGRQLVSGGTNRRLCVWEVDAGTVLWAKERAALPASVLTIAFLPGGKQFVTGMGTWATPGEMKVWNALTGENTITLRASSREITAVAVSPADGAIAATSHEGTIRVWGSHASTSAAAAAHRHRTEWKRAEQRGDWSNAAFHLSRLAHLTPEQPALALQAAHLCKLAGQSDRAALYATWAYLSDPTLPASPTRLAYPEGPGRWRIDGQELIQESRIWDDCWLLFGAPDWIDYDVEVEAKLVEGTYGACVGFRMHSGQERYAAAVGENQNTLAAIWRATGGRYDTLGDPARQHLDAGRWYQIKVEVRADRFRFLIDGKEVSAAQDGTHVRGRVGLRSWDAVNRFRNIRVTSPDGKVLFEGLPHLTSTCDPTIGPTSPPTADQLLARADALLKANDLDGALAAAREAVRLAPNDSRTHFQIGRILNRREDWAESVAAHREAIRLDPNNGSAHNNLGVALVRSGDEDGAIAEFREAVRLELKSAVARRNLGNALRNRGDLDGAVTACRDAVRLAPTDALAHQGLGLALRDQGRLSAAVDSLMTAKRNLNSPEIQHHLLETERWIELDRLLPGLLAGTREPASPAEALELAELCRQPFHKRYDLAVYFYRIAFAAEPKARTGAATFGAACAAAQLAAGNDPAARIGEDEWYWLQRRARHWLATEAEAAAGRVTGTTAQRTAVRRQLETWQRSRELLPVWDPAALAAMPAEERAAWEQLWAKVAAVIESTRPPVAPPPRPVLTK